MPRLPELHAYGDRTAFTRLMLLIATFVQHPGIGSAEPNAEPTDHHHNALEVVRDRLQQVAQELNYELPVYSAAMLRKDVETLRDYGILERRMYRWGYYLGTGGLNRQEFAAALGALATQAGVQGDPQLRTLYAQVERRLRGFQWAADQAWVYPVRSQIDQLIVHTDPAEMRRRGNYRETLFEALEAVEAAIVQGQGLELYARVSAYSGEAVGPHWVYPLQLLYHEVGWYLLYEECQTGHLAVRRLDRLAATVQPLADYQRSQAEQRQSLEVANRLFQQGWGLFLGQPEAQRLERAGELPLVSAQVRFFDEVSRFIMEGERRHPRQTIRPGPQTAEGRWQWVDYGVRLPERSLPEFFRWVNRFLEQAQVLAPVEWVERYRDRAAKLVERYAVSGEERVGPVGRSQGAGDD
jgi:WYL domain